MDRREGRKPTSLEKLVYLCTRDKRHQAKDEYWWNDFGLYMDVDHRGVKGEPVLLELVAELLMDLLPKEFAPDLILPASPDAMPLATALHLHRRLPLALFAQTRFGPVWLTDRPHQEQKLIVVDSLVWSGDTARELARLVAGHEAYYLVIADFSPLFAATAGKAARGWPEERFRFLLRSDRRGAIGPEGLKRNCWPIDRAGLLPEYAIHELWRGIENLRDDLGRLLG